MSMIQHGWTNLLPLVWPQSNLNEFLLPHSVLSIHPNVARMSCAYNPCWLDNISHIQAIGQISKALSLAKGFRHVLNQGCIIWQEQDVNISCTVNRHKDLSGDHILELSAKGHAFKRYHPYGMMRIHRLNVSGISCYIGQSPIRQA